MATEQDYQTALEGIARANLSGGAATAGMEGLDLTGLLGKYYAIKPYLDTILGMIAVVPVWGTKVAGAVKLLMTLVETIAPKQPQPE